MAKGTAISRAVISRLESEIEISRKARAGLLHASQVIGELSKLGDDSLGDVFIALGEEVAQRGAQLNSESEKRKSAERTAASLLERASEDAERWEHVAAHTYQYAADIDTFATAKMIMDSDAGAEFLSLVSTERFRRAAESIDEKRVSELRRILQQVEATYTYDA